MGWKNSNKYYTKHNTKIMLIHETLFVNNKCLWACISNKRNYCLECQNLKKNRTHSYVGPHLAGMWSSCVVPVRWVSVSRWRFLGVVQRTCRPCWRWRHSGRGNVQRNRAHPDQVISGLGKRRWGCGIVSVSATVMGGWCICVGWERGTRVVARILAIWAVSWVRLWVRWLARRRRIADVAGRDVVRRLVWVACKKTEIMRIMTWQD